MTLKPCLKTIFENEVRDPVFQVVEIKEVPSKDGTNQRYKFAISDGENYCPAMLSSQLSHLVINNELEKFQLIRAKNYNTIKNKKIIILLDIEILPERHDDVIGNPSPLNSKGSQNKEDNQIKRENEPAEQQRNSPPPNPAPKNVPMAPVPQPKPKPARPPTTNQYFQISSLTSYIPNWTILARVIQKGPIKSWSNSRGNGKLFSIVLKDKQGGEIRGTFFNDEADKFSNEIELDKVYSVTGGRIKAANTRYSNINHEYEITFDKNTTFQEASETEGESIGEITYNFTKLKEIENKEKDSYIDVIAVVSEVQPVDEIHSNKNNKSYSKRNLILADDSNATIECSLWNDDAINFPTDSVGTVIRIKSARVGEYHGKNISTGTNSIVKLLNHSDPQAEALYIWYDNNKDNIDSLEKISSGSGGGDFHAPMIYLEEINSQNLGKGEKPDNFCAYVVLKDIPVGRNIYYLACPNEGCRNKGVTVEGDKYICNNCRKVIEDPVPRYAMSVCFWDYSGLAYFSVLGDDGQNLLGFSAEEWKQQTDGFEETDKQKIVRPLYFKHYKITGRAKSDLYNNEERVKMSTSRLTEIDFADAAKFYAEEIKKF